VKQKRVSLDLVHCLYWYVSPTHACDVNESMHTYRNCIGRGNDTLQLGNGKV